MSTRAKHVHTRQHTVCKEKRDENIDQEVLGTTSYNAIGLSNRGVGFLVQFFTEKIVSYNIT